MMTEWLYVMKQVAESSMQLSTWALATAGGTMLIIVSTSYLRPKDLKWRLPFLLFIPGWIFLGLSINSGNKVDGTYLAALHISIEKHRDAALRMNELCTQQQEYFLIALIFFGVWLLIYLIAWVFCDVFTTEGSEK
jgi:hypothetical protein